MRWNCPKSRLLAELQAVDTTRSRGYRVPVPFPPWQGVRAGAKWEIPVISAIGDHVHLASTDFGHPDGRKYATAVQPIMELPDVSLESKHKLLWDNGLRAYPINAN
jgi:hypothetical protein